MKFMYNRKILYAIAAVTAVAAIFICEKVMANKAGETHLKLELYPTITADKGAGEDVAEGALIDALAANAVAEITPSDVSDFLVPKATEVANANPSFYIEGTPTVLIYHTHTTEAYRRDGDYTYEPSGEWRTNEQDKNIVAVGETLKNELEQRGFAVMHDTTNHEGTKLSTAYSRSLVTMEWYRQQYPDIDIYIDLHRDAANVETAQDDVVTVNGERCARLMFVAGTGEGTTTPYDPKPNFEQTYAFASAITDGLENIMSGFTRDVRVKPGRYNQHVSNRAILVEAGHLSLIHISEPTRP